MDKLIRRDQASVARRLEGRAVDVRRAIGHQGPVNSSGPLHESSSEPGRLPVNCQRKMARRPHNAGFCGPWGWSTHALWTLAGRNRFGGRRTYFRPEVVCLA